MKYDQTCSAGSMFLQNNVMSFNDYGGKICIILNDLKHQSCCEPCLRFYYSQL